MVARAAGTSRVLTRLGVRAIDRKVVRDLWHLRGPSLAIAVVVACGVACFVGMRAMVPHLSLAQQQFYATARFADLWVTVSRAPQDVVAGLARLPGVTAVETRVAGDVVVHVPGLSEPISGRMLGVPTHRVPAVNLLRIQSGRPVRPDAADEVVLSEGFANANQLRVGDTLEVVLHGHWERLHIVGTALSPEFVLEMRPGDLFPDSKRYGILWVGAEAAAAAFGMQGSWNEAAFTLAHDASVAAMEARLDSLLAPFGSRGAYGRHLQPSHRYLSDEITQARTFATVAPVIFFGVAMLLLHIVLSRLVVAQREQIGMLKAFGVTTLELARHYILLALGAVLPGTLAGGLVGLWLAQRLAVLYAMYYRIPDAAFHMPPGILASSCVMSVAAATVGAVQAVRRVAHLPAAEAMRPIAPTAYRPGIAERWRLTRWLSLILRMTLRGIERQPARAALSVLGMAMGVAVMMIGLFEFDAIAVLRTVTFTRAQREDVAVVFTAPRSMDVLQELAHLPGVVRSEPVHTVPVRMQHGQFMRDIALILIDPTQHLRQVVDAAGHPARVPADGLLLSRVLAEQLHVAVGDVVVVSVRVGNRRQHAMPVRAVVDDLVGTNAYVPAEAWPTLMGGMPTADGAVLRILPAWRDSVAAALARRPGVSGVSARATMLDNFDRVMHESFNVTLMTLLLFAGALAVGVVYNMARITVAERGRDLASLRVLGFTREEVAHMLSSEQFTLILLALPTGAAIGTVFSGWLARAISSDLFRLPVVLRAQTYAGAGLVLVVAGVASAVLVRRHLDRLDLVGVLKTRE